MYFDATSVIAVALVALVLVFIRISWTLKEIHEVLENRGAGSRNAVSAASQVPTDSRQAPADAAVDEKELAAVIAVAHAALRQAV